MSDDYALLYRAANQRELLHVQAALEAAGIQAFPHGGKLNITFGELGDDALRIDVWVRRPQLEAGRRVIEAMQQDVTSDAQAKEWRCTCGETNDASFDVCWSCGAAPGSGQ